MILNTPLDSYRHGGTHSASVIARHDPSTGLHDIKPIPQFAIENPSSVTLGLSAFGLLALCFGAYHLWKNSGKKLPEESPKVSHYDAALQKLGVLEKCREESSIEVRALAENLSSVVRLSLQEELGFPALEYTPGEIEHTLPGKLSESLPLLPKETIGELTTQCIQILRFCEIATFADNARERYPITSAEYDSTISEIKRVLRKIHLEKQREAERTRSVISDGLSTDSISGGV